MKRERSKNVYLKIVKRKGLLLKIFLLGLGLTTGVFLLFLFNSTSDRNFNYDNIKYDLIIDYAREDTIGVINNNLYVDDYQVLKSYYADYYTRSDEENRLIFNPVDGEEYGLFAHETPKSIVYILNEDNYEKMGFTISEGTFPKENEIMIDIEIFYSFYGVSKSMNEVIGESITIVDSNNNYVEYKISGIYKYYNTLESYGIDVRGIALNDKYTDGYDNMLNKVYISLIEPFGGYYNLMKEVYGEEYTGANDIFYINNKNIQYIAYLIYVFTGGATYDDPTLFAYTDDYWFVRNLCTHCNLYSLVVFMATVVFIAFGINYYKDNKENIIKSKLYGFNPAKIRNKLFRSFMMSCCGGILGALMLSCLVWLVFFREYGYGYVIIISIYAIVMMLFISLVYFYYIAAMKKVKKLTYVDISNKYKDKVINSNNIFNKVFEFMRRNIAMNIVCIVIIAISVVFIYFDANKLKWNKIADDKDSFVAYNYYDLDYYGYLETFTPYENVNIEKKEIEKITNYIEKCGGEADLVEYANEYIFAQPVSKHYPDDNEIEDMLNDDGYVFSVIGFSDKMIAELFEMNNIDKDSLDNGEAVLYYTGSSESSNLATYIEDGQEFIFGEGYEEDKDATKFKIVNKVEALPIYKIDVEYTSSYENYIIVNYDTYNEFDNILFNKAKADYQQYQEEVESQEIEGGFEDKYYDEYVYEEEPFYYNYNRTIHVKGLNNKQWNELMGMLDYFYGIRYYKSLSFAEFEYFVKNLPAVLMYGMCLGYVLTICYITSNNKCKSKSDYISMAIEKSWIGILGIIIGTICSLVLLRGLCYYDSREFITMGTIKLFFVITLIFTVVYSIVFLIRGLIKSRSN